MTLGLVVEGEAEYRALPLLLKAAGATPGGRTAFRGQGVQCSIETLVRSKLLSHTRAQILRRPSKVLVVIDREKRGDCPGAFAQRIHKELVAQLQTSYGYTGNPPVSVVCVDRSLENWLIADPEGIGTHAYIERDISKRVGARADGRDAVSIMQWAYGARRYYHKSKDAPHLAAKVRVGRRDVRNRSHSLDKFLREAGV